MHGRLSLYDVFLSKRGSRASPGVRADGEEDSDLTGLEAVTKQRGPAQEVQGGSAEEARGAADFTSIEDRGNRGQYNSIDQVGRRSRRRSRPVGQIDQSRIAGDGYVLDRLQTPLAPSDLDIRVALEAGCGSPHVIPTTIKRTVIHIICIASLMLTRDVSTLWRTHSVRSSPTNTMRSVLTMRN